MTPGAWIGVAMIIAAAGLVVIAVALLLRHVSTTPPPPTRHLEESTDTYRLDPIDLATWVQAEAFWKSSAGWRNDTHDTPNT